MAVLFVLGCQSGEILGEMNTTWRGHAGPCAVFQLRRKEAW